MSKWHKAFIKYPIEDLDCVIWLRHQPTRVKFRERPQSRVYKRWYGYWSMHVVNPEYICVKVKDPEVATHFKLKYNGYIE